ncbi:MAG: hypothetical protein ACJ74W_24045 [Pyrinomonadaceae bacterium]
MSQPNQTVRITGEPGLQSAAEDICRRFDEGEKRVPFDFPLSEERRQVRVIVTQGSFIRPKLKVTIDSQYCCRSCRKIIDGMSRKDLSANSLSTLLRRVVETIQNCSTCMENSSATPAPPSEPPVQPLRIRAEAPASRVKIISSDEAVANNVPAPPARREPAIRVMEPRGVTVLDANPAPRGGSNRTQGPNNRKSHHGISVRFRPDQDTTVDIVIPYLICEALISHCEDSNRHKHEVGGVLVGEKRESQRSDGGKYYQTSITDLIRFKPSDSSGAHLRVDESGWREINQLFEQNYAPRKKVKLGWYHTHPTQDIFFSPQDYDLHTIFKLPYQFAIVVDPRDMDAGIIFWENYPHAASEPHIFSLKRDRNADAGPTPRPAAPRAQRRRPELSLWRIFFFLVLTFVAVFYVLVESPLFSISPPNACLLALNAFLALRLWNAQFFRPEREVELHVLQGFLAALKSVFGWVGDRTGLPASFIALIFAGLIALGGLIFYYWETPSPSSVSRPNRHQQGALQASAGGNPSALDRQAGTAQNPKLYVEQTDAAITLSAQDGNPSVRFKRARGGEWEPESLETEREFFEKVFHLSINVPRPTMQITQLQQVLYANGGSADGGDFPNGVWDAPTRNAFVKKLLEAESTNQLFTIPQSNNRRLLSFEIQAPTSTPVPPMQVAGGTQGAGGTQNLHRARRSQRPAPAPARRASTPVKPAPAPVKKVVPNGNT